MEVGYHPLNVIIHSTFMHHMALSLQVILTSLLMKSLHHWYQKDQNIENKILSTGILTKEIIMDTIQNYATQ